MPYLIDEIGQISAADRKRLEAIRVRTTGELIQACSTPEGREAVIRRTGLDPDLLLRWVHLADLMRIEGVGRQYAELLGESGIETIAVLRRARPDELAQAVREANHDKRLAKTTPSPATIGRWVDGARILPSRVFP